MAETLRDREGGYLVEVAAADELPPGERAAALDAAAFGGGDPAEAFRRDAEATLARLSPERVAAEVARRAAAPPRRRTAWLAVPLLVTAAAGLVAVVVPRGALPPPAAPEGIRVKGLAPRLVVHRRTPGGAEVLSPGATAHPGDLVQLGYVAAGRAYGVIVSLDGTGAVTRHWPARGEAAAPLESGREVLLPESFRLDAAPRFERFFLVTSDRPFDVATVLTSARALAAGADAREARLALPPELAGVDVLLAKETP